MDKLQFARESILHRIECGEFPAEAKLPAAAKYCETIGVSFVVVQLAYNSLIRDGILYSIPRQGTFVRKDWRSRILPGSIQTYRSVWLELLKPLKAETPELFLSNSFCEGAFEIRFSNDTQLHASEYLDLTEFFSRCDFKPFKGNNIVRAIRVPGGASLSKGFHEKMLAFATKELGMGGLGYITVNEDMTYKGPIDKFIPQDMKAELRELAALEKGDLLFFIADKRDKAPALAGGIRSELGRALNLIEENSYKFCFIVDFPMYEWDDETGKWAFTHNPFSMPKGGLEALNTMEPDKITAYQYDVVLNGVELSSGAVRNHELPTMIKAFDIAGYPQEELEKRFGSLYNAFKFGAPPHAGMAPGVDRILMLLTNRENIREVIAFPMNKNAQDLLMGAPNEVTEQQLREIHVKIRD